jgi:hypothetical protein
MSVRCIDYFLCDYLGRNVYRCRKYNYLCCWTMAFEFWDFISSFKVCNVIMFEGGGSKKFCITFSVLYIVCKFCFILKFTAVFNVNYVKYLFKLF